MAAWRAASEHTSLTWAECARSALARADSGFLVTQPRGGTGSPTEVAVAARADGSPVLWVDGRSPAQLGTGPVVTLALPGHAAGWALHLVGTALPLGDASRPGHGELPACDCLTYVLSLRGVRLVGPSRISIPPGEFHQSDPALATTRDPVRHLELAHTTDLLSTVRDHGHDVLAVVPRATDDQGVHVAAIGADGVESLRLADARGASGSLAHLACQCGREQPAT